METEVLNCDFLTAAKYMMKNDPAVPFAVVNCDNEPKTSYFLRLERFPYYKILRNGKPKDYLGPRHQSALIDHMIVQTGPGFIPLDMEKSAVIHERE